jgi:hypothetical protein
MEKLKAVFEANPEAQVVFLTKDGQVFLSSDLAKQHNPSITPVSREQAYEVAKVVKAKTEATEKAPAKLSYEEREAAVENASTKEELEALLVGEKAKTLVSAITEKLESLT